MHHFGIIGWPLEHSFSAKYFAEKFLQDNVDADYQLCPVQNREQISTAMQHFDGFNVTYPYKQTIISHLSALDDIAQQIGAVNVVCQGIGYNTDWLGFSQSLSPLLTPSDRHALILGSGGVSKAVQFALNRMGILFTVVSRTPSTDCITYQHIDEALLRQYQIIINCTPLGMYPYIDTYPDIPYHALSASHILFDCVYNPTQTLFLQYGQQVGARIKNGLDMLYIQADLAWEIWSRQLNINL